MMMYQTRAPDVDHAGRMPYVQMLPPKDVAELACSICKQLGFYVRGADYMAKRMRDGDPIILEHNGYCMWVDRYYIALEDNSPSGFRYLYLTRRHAEEALRDNHRVVRAGMSPVLDSKTEKFLREAVVRMRAQRRAYMQYPATEEDAARADGDSKAPAFSAAGARWLESPWV